MYYAGVTLLMLYLKYMINVLSTKIDFPVYY